MQNKLHVFFSFFCPFFRAFTEKEKVLVRSEAFSTRSDGGRKAKWQKLAGGKLPQFCSLFICLSVFFTKSQFLYPMPVESELLKHLTIKIYADFMNFWYFS